MPLIALKQTRTRWVANIGLGFVILSASMTCSISSAFAWGEAGHKIVAAIAAGELTQDQRKTASKLLSAAKLPGLVQVGPWADQYRKKHLESGPWHFVDIPKDAEAYSESRDCHYDKDNNHANEATCVVAKIKEYEANLADHSRTDEQRGQDLAFLIHFVGDVHQPLHAAYDYANGKKAGDRGGNDVTVTFFGESQITFGTQTYQLNLHDVWDETAIGRMFSDQGVTEGGATATHATAVAESLAKEITPAQKKEWCSSDVVAWANESHKLAVDVAYKLPAGDVPALDDNYYNAAAPVIRVQLERAGERLACAIKKAL